MPLTFLREFLVLSLRSLPLTMTTSPLFPPLPPGHASVSTSIKTHRVCINFCHAASSPVPLVPKDCFELLLYWNASQDNIAFFSDNSDHILLEEWPLHHHFDKVFLVCSFEGYMRHIQITFKNPDLCQLLNLEKPSPSHSLSPQSLDSLPPHPIY